MREGGVLCPHVTHAQVKAPPTACHQGPRLKRVKGRVSVSRRSLEQLLVSLQWGRQQTYYPSAQSLSTGELAAANKRLAEAVKSHLLGNVGGSGLKTAQTSELCSSPAEKMAEKV